MVCDVANSPLRSMRRGVFYAAIRSDAGVMWGRYWIKMYEYIFPMYNIRFIALNDGIDTLNSDSADMDMMPIRNVFNEWHAANTSKKVRAVIASNAKTGKMIIPYCPYGYVKSDDEMRTPIIELYAAGIIRRIFLKCMQAV